MVNMSENEEATVVLVGTICSAIDGFAIAAPIPIEWKAPIIGLTTACTAAVLIWWKKRINIQKT